MEKAVVNMIDWELYVYDDRYDLSGFADYHPNLGKDAYIDRTSPVVNYKLDKEVLTYETCNTVYVCPLKYMTLFPYDGIVREYVEQLTHRADDSDNCLDWIIAVAAKIAKNIDINEDAYVMHIKELQKQGQREMKEMEERDDARLCDIAKNYEDCVYIEVPNIDFRNKLAYHFGDYLGIVLPSIYSGMFQEGVLYMKSGSEGDNDCRLNFGYFPKDGGADMETYRWSNNIKLVVIKNNRGSEIRFNKEPIQPGETKVFTLDKHC